MLRGSPLLSPRIDFAKEGQVSHKGRDCGLVCSSEHRPARMSRTKQEGVE